MSASETLARCQRLREALLGAMVQRESAVKHVLRRLPPTAGIMSLHRSDGTVLFEVPPPAVASWETAVDALGPPQLILLDAGFRLLSETEDELDDITAGLEGRVAVRNQLLQSLDRRVNRFVARQERKASGTDVDDDPTARSLDTIVLVRHRRMVARARANGTNPVSLEQVYRSMLMAQDESRFRELPDLDLQLQAEADDVERALRTFTWVLQGRLSPSDEEGWGSQHVDNVARDPWEMRLDRVARSVRVLRLASADMHNGVSATANHLRTLGQAASNAECAATLTRLGQNWHRLTADFETALEEDDDNDNNNGAGGEDVMRLARERVRLEQVVEPLLHRFEDCIQFEMAEDPTASSGYDDEHEYEYEEAAWQQFYRMGRRSRAELAALQEAHAKALFELSVGKDDANRYVSPLLMIETMTDVHRHIAFAHRIRAQLPADQRPPNLPDPEAVLDAFALAYVPAEWDRSPRPEQVVDDAITFVFEWLALSHLTEDYRVAFAQRARERIPSDPSNRDDPNLRLDREVRYVSAPLRSLRPLPTLRDAAVALAARLHQRHAAQKGMQLTAVR